jgi:hypothetical protein
METLYLRPARPRSIPIDRGESANLPAQPEPGSLIGKKVSHYRVLDVIGGAGWE